MKSKRIIPVFFILILSLFPTLPFIESAGYGEENENLGQFVDDFENTNNITVMVETVRNSTYNAIELNSTAMFTVIYNLTSLREQDYYAALTPDFSWAIANNDEIRMVCTVAGQGKGYMFLVVNSAWLDDKYVRFRYYPHSSNINPAYQHQYFQVYDGTYDRSVEADFPSGGEPPNKGNGQLYSYKNIDGLNNWFIKDFQVDTSGGSESNVTVWWMDIDAWNAISTGLYLDWIEINTGAGGTGNLITIDYRNLSPITMEQVGTQWDYGYAANPELPFGIGGYPTSGYFITEDYLNYTTGNSLALLTNASIPTGTSMTVQFSNDNATWLDNEGNVGSTAVLDGFYAIDLRDLNYSDSFKMYNLSTTDPMITPRLFQSRLVTTIGNYTIVESNVTGEWIDYNLTEIDVLIGVHDSGDVNSTLDIDGDTYNCSEVVGAPGYRISFNWTNVDQESHCLWVVAYVFYDGNQAHDIHVELWNFTSTTWVEIGTINDAVDFGWVNSSIYDLRMPNDFINSTGAVLGRFDHVAAGNINHNIYIEFLKLQAFIPFEDEAVSEQSFFWVFIAIVLSIIVGLLMWLKYEHNNN